MPLNSGESVFHVRESSSPKITSARLAASAWIVGKEIMPGTSLRNHGTKSRIWISDYGNLLMQKNGPRSRATMSLGPQSPLKSLMGWLAKGKTERGMRGQNQAGARSSERSMTE